MLKKLILTALTITTLYINNCLAESTQNEITFDKAINLALQNASIPEHKFIEEQLLRFNQLTEKEKQNLRALIMGLALKESDDVHKLNMQWMKHNTKQQQEIALYKLFGEKIDLAKRSRALSEGVEKAMNEPLREVKEVMKQVTFDLNENKPLEVKVAQNRVSQIILFDSTGEPFEIVDKANGNKEAFTVEIKTTTKNVISIDVKKLFTVSNASIYLKGHNIPIILKIVASQDVNTTRLKVRLKQRSPNANVSYTGQSKLADDDPHLDSFASGILPVGAKNIGHDFNDPSTDVYLYNGRLYVVTPYRLMNPGALDSKTTRQAGINNVYKIARASTFTLSVGMNAKPVSVNLGQEVFDVASSLEKKSYE